MFVVIGHENDHVHPEADEYVCIATASRDKKPSIRDQGFSLSNGHRLGGSINNKFSSIMNAHRLATAATSRGLEPAALCQ
jgi:hypothetical protein